MKKIIVLITILISVVLLNCKGDPKTNPVLMEENETMAPNRNIEEKPSLFEALERSPKYNSFLKLVNMARMFDELKALDNVTIFAPANADINGFIDNKLEGLSSAERLEKLRNIINYHIVDQIITGPVLDASVLPDEEDVYRLKTRQGAYISMVRENGNIIISDELMNDIPVVKLDIETTNGAIHDIGGILIPQDDNSVKTK